MVDRVIIIVLDSAGAGELPDAAAYGDAGSNTLCNIAGRMCGLNLPNLGALGLGNIAPIEGVPPAAAPAAAFGKMAEKSPGKDTSTGHWEMAGIILNQAFPTYPQGFPPELIREFEERIGRPTLGNVVASGTEIIKDLGPEHLKTGYPIVYTSADSVFQIAAHEEIIPLAELYRMCEIAREMLTGAHAVGRVIARPFVGEPGNFQRTANRHDYALLPPKPNLLSVITDAGLSVVSIGKIKDIFAGQNITDSVHTENNQDALEQIGIQMRQPKSGLLFANLVDFDMLYGHRNDCKGYAGALEQFDRYLPRIMAAMRPSDVLIVTADHGCDPTTASTDHSREYVPLLICGQSIKPGVALGIRSSFADLGATVADLLGVGGLPAGRSMMSEILKQ